MSDDLDKLNFINKIEFELKNDKCLNNNPGSVKRSVILIIPNCYENEEELINLSKKYKLDIIEIFIDVPVIAILDKKYEDIVNNWEYDNTRYIKFDNYIYINNVYEIELNSIVFNSIDYEKLEIHKQKLNIHNYEFEEFEEFDDQPETKEYAKISRYAFVIHYI